MQQQKQADHSDKALALSTVGANLLIETMIAEQNGARGVFDAVCWEPRSRDRIKYIQTRDALAEIENKGIRYWMNNLKRAEYLARKLDDFEQDFNIAWVDHFPNVVTTVGKNLALDTYLAGSGYTVTGPYMGLISSTSWSAVAAGDTMSSHAGWLEAGNANTPTYSGNRKTAAWSAASSGSKALSAALTFSATGTGTVKGCFLVFGSGALSTIDNTAGTLYSAGTFTGGDQPVVNGNTLSVSYSTAL